MSDKEKFEGFKQRMIEENEKKYGEEIRGKYGKDLVEKSNAKLMYMSQEQYDSMVNLENQIKQALAEAFKTGDPASDLAQKAAELHKQWLTSNLPGYT